MSPASRSRTPADTLRQSRPRTGTTLQNPVSSRSHSSRSLPGDVAYARVVAKIDRVRSVLVADVGLSLPAVSVNDLERGLSAFLDEIRLGLERRVASGDSSTTRGSGGGRRQYGPKVRLEIEDPDRAKRVRENRAIIREEQAAALHSRQRR